jgi:hypothetical protein
MHSARVPFHLATSTENRSAHGQLSWLRVEN